MKTSAVLVNGFFAALFSYALYFDYGLPTQFRPIPELYVSKFGWLTMVDLVSYDSFKDFDTIKTIWNAQIF